jgi:hypothetical protein
MDSADMISAPLLSVIRQRRGCAPGIRGAIA